MTYHMRRHDLAITDEHEIERILLEGRHATIALTDGDQPYLVTLSYGYDPKRRRLVFHSATAGRKLDLIAKNPRACATVVVEHGYNTGECEHPYSSVVMHGTMEMLDDLAEVREAMRTLIRHLETGEAVETIYEQSRAEQRLASFRMLAFQIEDLSAKTGK